MRFMDFYCFSSSDDGKLELPSSFNHTKQVNEETGANFNVQGLLLFRRGAVPRKKENQLYGVGF